MRNQQKGRGWNGCQIKRQNSHNLKFHERNIYFPKCICTPGPADFTVVVAELGLLALHHPLRPRRFLRDRSPWFEDALPRSPWLL
mmetsp:Transcript_158/g.264  ORF Transcript_158/g.264 Transcript_158/m.264 type:complete len:85 (-) Transcript_158:1820-2074(-)